MSSQKDEFGGEWRIVETEMWDREALERLGPSLLFFGPEQVGELEMIAIVADLDYRVSERDGLPLIEFTIEGEEEGDRISGRGWAVLRGPSMRGHLYFHGSDDSEFLAERPKA